MSSTQLSDTAAYFVDPQPTTSTTSSSSLWSLPITRAGPVGGLMEPVSKLAVFAPSLALFGLAAIVAVGVAKPWKKPDN
jgi:hypothetical protein